MRKFGKNATYFFGPARKSRIGTWGSGRSRRNLMPMHPRERLAYSPIEGRPPLKFPKGVRLVIWPVFALEEWDMARPMARMVISPPQGQPMLPDHPNWSWHEYGMRVGFWRRSEERRVGKECRYGGWPE